MRSTKSPRKAKHDLVHDASKCVLCQNEQEFEIPDHLIKQLTSGNAVIFAGAGVSTETRTVIPWTFYEEIHEALGMSKEDKPAFPKLMSLYCKRPDGRRELLEKLRARLSYIQSFPELYRTAKRIIAATKKRWAEFHRLRAEAAKTAGKQAVMKKAAQKRAAAKAATLPAAAGALE